MAGYCVYAFCALGLAGFVPRPRAGGHPWLGARLFTGFSLIPVFLFLVHIIAGVGLLAAAYALVALSAYHERFRAGGGDDMDSGSEAHGLRQYNTAIRALRDDPTMHLQLVSCTIFVCIEVGGAV